MEDREYQRELIELVKGNNALIVLPTGSGKTDIAARVIQQQHLPAAAAAKAAGSVKAIVFLAPTNPLVAQQCIVLKEGYGMAARAYHGDDSQKDISSWSADIWAREVAAADVMVMTPDVLLHLLAHGSMTMRNISLLVFDEAHHCNSDHPYAQIMEDFYHTLEPQHRPQVLGFTASPKGLEGAEDRGIGASKSSKRKRGKSKGAGAAAVGGGEWGLQQRLDARLVTVADHLRQGLADCVPVPANELLQYADDDPAWAEHPGIAGACTTLTSALEGLTRPAKLSEAALAQLQHYASLYAAGQLDAEVSSTAAADLACFAAINEAEFGSMEALDKQVRGTKTCLESLGPWPATMAAHLDMLAAIPEEEAAAAAGSSSISRAPEPAPGSADAEAVAAARARARGIVDIELAKMLAKDDLGKTPEELLQELGFHLKSVYDWLAALASSQPAILTPAELATAANSSSSRSSSTPHQLAALAPALLRLAGKAAVLMVVSVLGGLLMPDADRDALLRDPDVQAAASSAGKRARGQLQHAGAVMLQHVPDTCLQAQVWPNLPQSTRAPAWRGAPLLSPKLLSLLRSLATQQADADGGGGSDDWWSAIVFVETKLSALVVSQLLQRCPDMATKLRADYLIGDTEPGGRSQCLSMDTKAQARVVDRFRRGDLNLLVATNIGSEGMDFKQCVAVVAFEPPPDLTSYIQARGRARKQGSQYCWLVPRSTAAAKALVGKQSKLISDAQLQDELVRETSAATRQLLQQHRSSSSSSNPAAAGRQSGLNGSAALPHNAAHLLMPKGGIATLRLAQPLLIGFCTKLDWGGRAKPPQAFYRTVQLQEGFHTTVYLPSSSGIWQPVATAPCCSNAKASKNAGALQALKELRQAGRLDDWLQPKN